MNRPNTDRPKVLYLPFTPGSPDDIHMDWIKEQINARLVDALVIETTMSGATPKQHPFGMSQFILDAADKIPVFMLRQGSHIPRTTRQNSLAESINGITFLEGAYSGIADKVVVDIQGALQSHDNPKDVMEDVRRKYRLSTVEDPNLALEIFERTRQLQIRREELEKEEQENLATLLRMLEPATFKIDTDRIFIVKPSKGQNIDSCKPLFGADGKTIRHHGFKNADGQYITLEEDDYTEFNINPGLLRVLDITHPFIQEVLEELGY